jgi:hypothetical protein
MGGGLCIDFINDSLVWQIIQLLDGAAKTGKGKTRIKNMNNEQTIVVFFMTIL